LKHPVRTIVVITLVLVVAGVAWSRFGSGPGRTAVTVTELERRLEAGGVEEVKLLDRDHVVVGEFTGGERFRATVPEQYVGDFTAKVVAAGVDLPVDGQRSSRLLAAVIQSIPILLILGLVIFVLYRMRGGSGALGMGRSRARRAGGEQTKVTFADVAGADEAVEELRELAEFLSAPEAFGHLGARIPKGVLLFGPPGTGKTLLARAVAGEAGVPFFSISGSDFVEMFVGVGAARVRDLFERAKAAAPAIVFIDELDAVGRQRGTGVGGGHDEREQTLNQLLVEMDGFEAGTGVILVAATNRPDILDPALLRPGRFDRQVVVDRPDVRGRRAILEVHARGKPLAEGIDLMVVARRTPGFTGADLANVLNEAALLAGRREQREVDQLALGEAVERVIAGPERSSRVISERERRMIAYHEGGHAVVGHALPGADTVHKVSIIPRGRSLGYTITLPSEDRTLASRSELFDQLAVLLGGRTAEEMVFGDPTTGAQNDIEKATGIARQMVTQWGMSDELGPVQLGQNSTEVFLGRDLASTPDYSDAVAAKIDGEIRSLLDSAHSVARAVLTRHRDVLEALAGALMERETLEADEVAEILEPVPSWAPHELRGSGSSTVAAADPGD